MVKINKKTNAILGILLVALVLIHTCYTAYMLLSGAQYGPINRMLGVSTEMILLAHAAISIANFFNGTYHKITYMKENMKTALQRDIGMLMTILSVPHCIQFVKLLKYTPPRPFGFALLQIVFYFTVFLHIAISCSKAFITLGLIQTDKAEKTVNTATTIVCAISFVFMVIVILKLALAIGRS